MVLGIYSLPAIAAEPAFTASPAFFDGFDPGWEGRQTDWRIATWMQNGTQMARERSQTDGLGNTVQTVLAGEPYRGGSMQSNREFGFGRWIARVKPSNVDLAKSKAQLPASNVRRPRRMISAR